MWKGPSAKRWNCERSIKCSIKGSCYHFFFISSLIARVVILRSPLSFYLILVETHNYINKCVSKTLQQHHNWLLSPFQGCGTCQITNMQYKHANEEIVLTCSNKQNWHINTPVNFHKYVSTINFKSHNYWEKGYLEKV